MQLSEKEKTIINAIGDNVYTAEYIEGWAGHTDDVRINAPAALIEMGVAGFMTAVRDIANALGESSAAKSLAAYSKINKSLDAFMPAAREAKNRPPQEIYIMEECSELIKECAKYLRDKGNVEDYISEACDVISALLVLFRTHGYDMMDIAKRIAFKYDRAVERMQKNNEV